MKTWYIYGHWTKDTNELFYIGVGVGDRLNRNSGRNILWKNIVNKHGYEIEIILDGYTDRGEAVKEEIRLQQLNKPRACLQYGDKLNKIVSEETKAKISANHSRHNKGKTPSLETKEKLRQAHLGKKLSDETKELIKNVRTGTTQPNNVKKKISKASSGDKNGFYGKKHSLETKKKMSEARKGKIPWNKGKTKK